MRLEPKASTRACSSDSKIALASGPPGTRFACTASSWYLSRNARLSAAPRSCATSSAGRSRAGLGRRTRRPDSPAGSGPNVTLTSSSSAIARNVVAVARLKISVGEKSCAMRPVTLLHQGRVDAGLGQLGTKAALVVFRHRGPLGLVALVEERQPERKGEIVEDAGVLGPCHHRARRH